VKSEKKSTRQVADSRPRVLKALTFIFILCLVMPLPLGCGLKAPPVAPKQPPLPTIRNLTAALEKDQVTLQWNQGLNEGHVAGYIVYRAAMDLSKEPCPGCPMIFQKLTTLGNEGRSEHFSYTDAVFAGFRFTYKVTPFYSSGATGPDSNLVVVEMNAGQ
jgi:hypothetical protein